MTTGLVDSRRPVEAVETLPGTVAARPSRSLSLPGWLGRWTAALVTVLLAAAILVGLGWGYVSSATEVAVSLDGMSVSVLSHLDNVGDLLAEMQVVLQPEDRLHPAADTPLSAAGQIGIERARPVLISGDSRLRDVRTHVTTLPDLFAEAGIALGEFDELSLEGEPASADARLPSAVMQAERNLAGVPAVYPWQGTAIKPVMVSLRRALPLVITAAGVEGDLWTTASTVGEALDRAGVTVYEGDLITPGLGEPVEAGLRVAVERSTPVTLVTSAGALNTRSRSATVADLLSEQGLLLAGLDRVDPPLETPLSADLDIHVTRVERAFEVAEDITRYVSVWAGDSEMEIDTSRLDQEGVNGITRHRYVVTLEDGQPITSTLQETWLAQQPITQVLKYGTNIVLREVETPDGSQTYWRKIRMFATSYSPADAGTPRDAPWYGRTRIGLQAGYGIVAVDPSVVRLRSQLYVPGYGPALAGDTGSGIRGKWIDLGYDDGTLRPWSRCVDVYLLGQPPPSYQIQYRLPNSPQVSCLRR